MWFVPTALLSQRPVTEVEINDPGLQRNKVRVVVDHVIGNGKPVRSAGLSIEYSFCLFARFGIAGQQALDLRFLVAIDDEHPIDKVPQR